MAKSAEAQGKSSIDMAKAAHRLNVLAAFFFPIVTLALSAGHMTKGTNQLQKRGEGSDGLLHLLVPQDKA